MMAESNLSEGTGSEADAVKVPVADMDNAERFYVGALGAERLERFDAPTGVKRRASGAAAQKRRASPLSLRLGARARFDLCLHEPSSSAAEAISLAVDGPELDALRAHLVSAGVPVDGPRGLGVEGHAALYFIDPFGNRVELVTAEYPGSASLGSPSWETLAYEWRG
ncbi:MAG TPA: VOC family protein [Polyangiaceae bacterium]|nr:VOC family protein [Polyangiaceae bacterium]